MIAYQRAFIYYHAMRSRQSHVVYPGIELFDDGTRLQSPHEIPGVLEGGWQNLSLVTPRGITDRDRSHSVSKLNGNLKALYERVRYHECAWPFLEPVTEDQAPGYFAVIKNPIDLEIIGARLKEQTRIENESRGYYRTKEMLRADLLRMVECHPFHYSSPPSLSH
jgi:hypothetical protein